MLPVVLTVVGSKESTREARASGSRMTVAELSTDEVSVPMMPSNGLVTKAGVGFKTLPISRMMSEMKVLVVTAP